MSLPASAILGLLGYGGVRGASELEGVAQVLAKNPTLARLVRPAAIMTALGLGSLPLALGMTRGFRGALAGARVRREDEWADLAQQAGAVGGLVEHEVTDPFSKRYSPPGR